MEALRKLVNNVINLDINEILSELWLDVSIQKTILDLNREDQLFDKGIDSLGISLESIGGAYSPVTVQIKRSKGQPTDRVTLKDTGDFYETFRIKVGPTFFDIDADPKKDETDLFVEWGEDILGLTDESLEILQDILLPLIINKINGEIRNL